jgi:hypothetical protein
MAIQTTQITVSNTSYIAFTGVTVAPVTGNAITTIMICNTGNNDTAVISMWAVPNAAGAIGAASTSNQIVNALAVPGGETVSFDQEKLVFGNNDTLVVSSNVSNMLTVLVSYIQV